MISFLEWMLSSRSSVIGTVIRSLCFQILRPSRPPGTIINAVPSWSLNSATSLSPSVPPNNRSLSDILCYIVCEAGTLSEIFTVTTYIISYDLNAPGQNYTDLFEAIKGSGTWWHHLDSTWIVKSNLSAKQIRDTLSPTLDSNDKVLVAALSGVAAWKGFNDKGSKWLKDNL